MSSSTPRSISQSEARLLGHTEQRGRVEHLFTAEQLAGWKALAAELNRTGQGDELTFYLTSPR